MANVLDGVANESTALETLSRQRWTLIVSEICLPFLSAFIFLLSSLFLAGGVFETGAGAEGAAGAGGSEAVGLETHWMLCSAEGTDTSFTVKNKSNYFTSLLKKLCFCECQMLNTTWRFICIHLKALLTTQQASLISKCRWSCVDVYNFGL